MQVDSLKKVKKHDKPVSLTIVIARVPGPQPLGVLARGGRR